MKAIFGAILIMSAFLMACGDSSSALSPNLEDVILDEQSVPQRFTSIRQEQIDNNVMAQKWSDPDTMVANYEVWGRIEGIEAEFNTGTVIGNLVSVIGVYQAKEGAREAFKYMRREGRTSTIQGFQEHGFIQDGTFEDLEDPKIGDESFAIYGVFSMPAITLKNMWTVFRKENVIGLLRWGSDTNEIEQQVLAGIAQKQLDLIVGAN